MSEELAVQPKETLFDIEARIANLFEYLNSLEPNNPEAPDIARQIDESLQSELRKVSGIVMYREGLLANAARCDAMQKRFLDARLAWEKQAEQLEGYVKRTMEAWDKTELVGEGLKIKLKRNPPSVVLDDDYQGKIPEKFWKTVVPPPVRSVNKAAIAKALKAGEEVPGVDLNISSTRVDWGDKKGKEVEVAE